MSSEALDSGAVKKIESQILGDVPHSWIKSSLGECFTWGSGGTPKSNVPGYYDGDIPWLVIGDLNDGLVNFSEQSITEDGLYNSSAKLVEPGTLLLAMYGSIGKLGIAGVRLATNQAIAFCLENSINTKYLFNFLRFARQHLVKLGKGATQQNISQTVIKAFPFPLPPLNEQKRIVAKIEELFSELDNGIAALKTAREQLKVYRQAVLKHAFEGKLTAQWRKENADKLETPEQLLTRIQQEREARYQQQLVAWKAAVKDWEARGKEGKKPGKPKDLKAHDALPADVTVDLPEVPASWFWDKLAYITTGVEYGTSAKSAETGLVPVIRMGNLQNGKIDWSDLVYTSDEEEIEKYKLETNDVLFNRTNSPELVGKTAKYKGEKPALFAGYLIRINQIDTVVSADYLNYFLNSHIAKRHGNSVKTDGVNQSNINGEKLKSYPFPFCSLTEQSAIVNILEEKLSLTDVSIQDIDLQLEKAETLRQSILKKAFSGQLVPQDPNDEPASELLARIKAEKEAQRASGKKPAAKRGRKPKEALA